MEDFIKLEAGKSGMSVRLFKKMMKQQNECVAECGCGHPRCKAHNGMIIENIGNVD